jgi:hypothetical protein
VVYNPMGNQKVTIAFDKPRRSLATGRTAKEHRVGCADGDVLLEIE